jgi:CHAT domain-containing protein
MMTRPRAASVLPAVMIAVLARAASVTGASPDPFASCEASVAAHPGALDNYGCYRRTARRTGQQAEAARRLRALLHRDARNDAARLALATVRADQYADEAEGLYRAAAEGFAARAEAEGEALARVGLAAFLQIRGRLDDGTAELKKARRAAEASEDAPLLDRVRIGEAWDAYRRNDYGRALRLLEEAKAEVFARGTAESQSAWLAARATANWAVNRLEEAAHDYRRQADLLEREGDRYEEAAALANVAFMAGVNARPAGERLAVTRQTLAAAIAGGNRAMEGRAHWHLSQLTAEEERTAHVRRFLAISRETKKASDIVLALRSLAVCLKEQDPDEAYRLLDEAIAFARRLGDVAELARNRVTRANIRWTTGPRDAAVADSLGALDAIEAMRNLQPEGTVRSRRFSAWAPPYRFFAGHLLAGFLLEPGKEVSAADVEVAFSIIERQRARTLLDELDAAQASAVLVPRGPRTERRSRVFQAIVDVQRRLMGSAVTDDDREQTLVELERLEREEEALRAELAEADPSFAALRPPRLATLADVQASLADDEAMLSFLVGWRTNDDGDFGGGTWLIVQTRQGTRVHSLRVTADELINIPLFLGLLDRRDGSEATAAARLYRDLLKDALDALPSTVRRLVVVPDSFLLAMPFEALRPEADAEPLGTRYQVSVVPSATLWLRLRHEAPAHPETPALALADPDVPGALSGDASERQWALAEAVRLGRLPHARAEARFVVQRLGGGSTLLTGPEATERFLKETGLRRFGLLHIAAHSLVDDEKPERSAILLAPGAPEEDGLLQTRELVRLDLRGAVVVLSACRSAGGPILSGEGVIGLSRAFFQAGARTVVGSLWPLRDDETERVFRSFYRHLAEGGSVSGSLSAARRDAIRAGLPAAAWAGLVVLGDGDVVPLPGGRRAWPSAAWTATLVVAALLLAVLLMRRARGHGAA